MFDGGTRLLRPLQAAPGREDPVCPACGASQPPPGKAKAPPPAKPHEPLVAFAGACLGFYLTLGSSIPVLLGVGFVALVVILALYWILIAFLFLLALAGILAALAVVVAGAFGATRAAEATLLAYVRSPEGRTPPAALAGLGLFLVALGGCAFALFSPWWSSTDPTDGPAYWMAEAWPFARAFLIANPIAAAGLGGWSAHQVLQRRDRLWAKLNEPPAAPRRIA